MNRILTFVLILIMMVGTVAFADDIHTVKLGCSGENVRDIQLKLISFGYLDNKCMIGYFGENTEIALNRFQSDNNLTIDGIAGSKTINAIEDYLRCANINRTYKIGDGGDEVRIIQWMLAEKGYLGSFSISGKYGQITENAVKKFQEDNSLSVDGVVGSNTLMKLVGNTVIDVFIQDCTEPNKEYLDNLYNVLDENQKQDIYILSQLITAESGYEPYIGQVAVGSVVMNRMKHDNQTMQQVIFRKNAFSVVKNGKINRTPTQQCRYAAIQAYFGAKPVSNARFFNGKHLTTSWAALHCTLYTIIGNHAFYI